MTLFPDKGSRLPSVLAQRLQNCLATDTQLEPSLLDEVASMQNHAQLKWRHLTPSERITLDKIGTALWNALLRAQWHREEQNDLQVRAQGQQNCG